MAIFRKVGTGEDERIIDKIIQLDLEKIPDEIMKDDFSKSIAPLGKLFSEKAEYLLREGCLLFLENLGSRLTEGIFSISDIHIKSADVSKGKSIGYTDDESKEYVFVGTLLQYSGPLIAEIQILHETFSNNEEEYKRRIFCRLLSEYEEKGTDGSSDPPPSEGGSGVEETEVESESQPSFLDLDETEMWGVLQRIQFYEMSAARLFGEKLVDELKKLGYDISGGKVWKRRKY